MKKETIIAIVLGVLTGVVIAVFLIINSQNKKADEKAVISPQISPTIKLIQQEVATVTISEPQTNSVSIKDSITIKGVALKDSLIVITSPTSEKVQKNADGNFSIQFPLSLGENKIKITSYYKKDTHQKELVIYFFGNE